MPWWKRDAHAQRDPRAVEARQKAERELAERRVENSRVEMMTAGWRRIREENHFASAINATFRGEEPA